MPDQEIYQSIMSDIDAYTGKQGSYDPKYLRLPYPQKLGELSKLLKLHTLRECGDYKKYLILQQEIFSLAPDQIRPEDKTLYQIILWVDTQIQSLKPTTPENNTIVISQFVYGATYIEKLLEYNLKSLMAEGNLPALAKEKRVIFYFQTDAAGRNAIEAAPITQRMKALGALFDYAIIPDALIDRLDTNTNYWMLGACGTLAVNYAKSMHAALHHAYPDCFYSEKFFTEVLRLSKTHTAILGQGTRSDETLLIPTLAPYTTHEALSVPAPDLMALHMNAMHLVAWPYIVNNRSAPWTYPQSHVMIWEADDAVYFNCPHLNIYWLDYSVIKNLPVRFYHTLDSELDLLIPGEDYYIPGDGDSLYTIEMSLPERNEVFENYNDLMNTAFAVWHRVKFRDTMKFFLRGMKVPINRTIRPLPANHISGNQLTAERNTLFNVIIACDQYRDAPMPRQRTHLGYIYV